MSQYQFFTCWEVESTPEEVYRILEKPEDLPRWWPSVYLDVDILETGQPGGVGKRVTLFTKGWLPYTLRWEFVVSEVSFPTGFKLKACGDFEGTGVWHFQAVPGTGRCEVTYDWRISAEKPLLKYLSFLMRPLFSANHRWAMRKGLQSLDLELKRRHAATEEERKLVPPPPGPTFPHNLRN
ncbi:MAG TPA: SRPBCC family protein [Flavilitoribacter sp.]|nr:SRPBCC family protein [Flavilitoribacter sp.]HMQ86493.1 SRPBCC family protein [Flavilitoribacter sp.]